MNSDLSSTSLNNIIKINTEIEDVIRKQLASERQTSSLLIQENALLKQQLQQQYFLLQATTVKAATETAAAVSETTRTNLPNIPVSSMKRKLAQDEPTQPSKKRDTVEVKPFLGAAASSNKLLRFKNGPTTVNVYEVNNGKYFLKKDLAAILDRNSAAKLKATALTPQARRDIKLWAKTSFDIDIGYCAFTPVTIALLEEMAKYKETRIIAVDIKGYYYN